MKAGKLSLEFLEELLNGINVKDPRVVLGAKPGEDAALIDFDNKYLVTKTDPITFATDLIGWYVVQVNANDLAVMGATPKWIMVTLLLPEGISENEVKEIFRQLIDACDKLNVTLIGGHTEITYQLPRPIAIGSMIGEVTKDRVVYTSGASPGDSILLTKGIALEGTAILAREAEFDLRKAGVSTEVVEHAKSLLFKPGISVLQEASIACDTVRVSAMHDPTEGGLATGLMELAKGAKVGLTVEASKIPILPECSLFCSALGLDPMGLIASGSLIATVSPTDAPKLINAWKQLGIKGYEIGHITELSEGLTINTDHGSEHLPFFERDELARFLAKD